jgi:hypothetical protein
MMEVATANQTPQQKRGAALRRLLESAFRDRQALARVNGNILIFVPNVATWTLVTKGSNPGLRDFATNDEIAFALSCDDTLLLQLMTGADVDFAECVESGRLKIQGDVKVLVRFVNALPE